MKISEIGQIQRWDFDARTDVMEPFPEGVYVEYNDHALAVTALSGEISRLRAIVSSVRTHADPNGAPCMHEKVGLDACLDVIFQACDEVSA